MPQVLGFLFEGDPTTVFTCCWLPIILIVVIIIGGFIEAFKQQKIDKEVQLATQKRLSDSEREATARAELGKMEKQEQLERLEKSMGEYFTSLEKLKADPTNPDLKQLTLALGRKYSELSRTLAHGNAGITVYDEVSILNEISAVSAVKNPRDELNQPLRSAQERLTNLIDIKEKGLMSETEFQERRKKILDEI